MKDIEININLIAACGLYCAACRKHLAGKCPGCHLNQKASWCKIRKCVQSKGINSCADCEMDVCNCKTYSNLIGKIFSILFKSDRPACIAYIRQHGRLAYATEMTSQGQQTMKRK